MPRFVLTIPTLFLLSLPARAEDRPKPSAPADRAIEELVATARKSVVVITFAGRDGKRLGLGTGFVVGKDGLIATNLHVLGEGRPITVLTADGKRYEATAVHASDRSLDLALLRIDAHDLPALELGDSDALKEGQPVVALGNPHGLTNSVVSGVVSGKREIDGRPMIQLAIPVERGNSGGPLLDLQGRVQGILTMKSLVTVNLGFAVGINSLKPLLQKPNPVPMARWVTFGALDPKEWTTLFGARWHQRGGHLLVEGPGSGFGGRSLCLSERSPPEVPYEVAVTVRLDDEAGAAGLAFLADGHDRHYGFYPTAGRLRFTRFDGPDVFSWKVLREEPSAHYRPGEWNTLKVRIEKDKLLCSVNDHVLFEAPASADLTGKVGLAKFRDTRAEFKDFHVAARIRSAELPPEQLARVTKAIEGLPSQEPPPPGLVEKLLADAPASVGVLRDRAKQLEQQAAQLRGLAEAVHQRRVQAELLQALEGKEDDIDLVRAALLVARLDNDELHVADYQKVVDRLAAELTAGLPKDADEKAKLAALNKFLFEEQGFHGSRSDYYNRSNSYLNDVLDDREGLPITLSVLYLELGRRIGLKVVGVALPGHFVVKHVPAQGKDQLIDVFEGGQALTRDQAADKVRAFAGEALREEQLAAVPKKAIILRMLRNLLGVARREGDAKAMLRYLETVLALAPDAAEERGLRAALLYQTGDRTAALRDLDWLLEHRPAGVDRRRVQELRRMIEGAER